jgi:hypothetical protein
VAGVRRALLWGTIDVFDLRLSLPETWTAGRDFGEQGKAFLGPEEEGFRTSVVLNRKAWPQDGAEWRAFYVAKFDDPQQTLVRVLDRGVAEVAGAEASLLVYEERSDPFVTMDWYFWRGGHGYVLRCTATRRTFLVYRPVFEEIARRLRPRGA